MGRWILERIRNLHARRVLGTAIVLLAVVYVASRHPQATPAAWLRTVMEDALAWLPRAAMGFQEHPVAWLSLALLILLHGQLRALVGAVAGTVHERSVKLEIKGVLVDLGEPRALDSVTLDAQPALPSVSSWDEPAITETFVLSESAGQIDFEMRAQPPATDEQRQADAAAGAALEKLKQAASDEAALDALEQSARHLFNADFFGAERLSRLVEADERLQRLVQEARLRAESKPPQSDNRDELILLAVGRGWAETGHWSEGLKLLKPLVDRPAPFLPAGPVFLACAYNDLVQRQVVESSGDMKSDEFLKQLDKDVLTYIVRLDDAAMTFNPDVWSRSLSISNASAIAVRRELWNVPGVIQALVAQNTANGDLRQERMKQSRALLERAARPIGGVEPGAFVLSNLANLQSGDGEYDAAHATLDRIPKSFRDPISARTRADVFFAQDKPAEALEALRRYPIEWADRPGTAREYVDLQLSAVDHVREWKTLPDSLRRAMALDILERASEFANAPERRTWFIDNPKELINVEEQLGRINLEERAQEARAVAAFERLERLVAEAPSRRAPPPERRCEWLAWHARARVRMARGERLLLSLHAAKQALAQADARCRELLGVLEGLPLSASDPTVRRRRRVLARVHALDALLAFGDEAIAQQRLEWAEEAIRAGARDLLAALRSALFSYPDLKHVETEQNDGRIESLVNGFEARQARLDGRLAIAQDPDGQQPETKDLVVQRYLRAIRSEPPFDTVARLELARFLLVLALRGRADGMECLRDAREALERAALADTQDVRAEALRLLTYAWSMGATVERRQKQSSSKA